MADQSSITFKRVSTAPTRMDANTIYLVGQKDGTLSLIVTGKDATPVIVESYEKVNLRTRVGLTVRHGGIYAYSEKGKYLEANTSIPISFDSIEEIFFGSNRVYGGDGKLVDTDNMHGFIRDFEIYSPGLSDNDFKNMVNKNYI